MIHMPYHQTHKTNTTLSFIMATGYQMNSGNISRMLSKSCTLGMQIPNWRITQFTMETRQSMCWVFNGNRKGVSPFPLKAPSQLPTLQRKEISAISVSSCKSSPLVLVISLQIYFLTLSTQWHAFTGMGEKNCTQKPKCSLIRMCTAVTRRPNSGI